MSPESVAAPEMTEALRVDSLAFSYGARRIVDFPEFGLERGRACALVGPSGCGKTTFLHLAAGLLRAQRGSIAVDGQSLGGLDDAALDRLRARRIGLIFQKFHLLPALSVLENLLIAQRLARLPTDRSRALALLDRLGIAAQAQARPDTLSQGQTQRVAIARALLNRPALLLADEPTSSLDRHHATRAIALLREEARHCGAALLVVTHDERVADAMDRCVAWPSDAAGGDVA